jgi:hypothetical protein
MLILNIEDKKWKFCKSEQNTKILAFGEDNSTNKEKQAISPEKCTYTPRIHMTGVK